MVTVHIAQEAYGIPITLIESIVRWEPLTRLPRMPRFLAGLYNLRGKPIPVVDMRDRLDLPVEPCGDQQRIVITRIGDNIIGLIVDAVREVLWIAASCMETHVPLVSHDANSGEAAYLRGVANLPQGFVILLDLEKLFSTKEQKEITKLETRSAA